MDAYGTVGEIFAWIIGWGLILEYAMGSMTVAVSWSGYFGKLLKMFGLHLPDWLTTFGDPQTYLASRKLQVFHEFYFKRFSLFV